MTRTAFITLALFAALAAGCMESEEASPTGLANPASVYCAQSGGTTRMREDSTGVRGVCVLADGTEVDEWDYYRAHTAG